MRSETRAKLSGGPASVRIVNRVPRDTTPRWDAVAAVAVTVLAWASAFVVLRAVAGDYDAGPLALGRLLVGRGRARGRRGPQPALGAADP